MDKKRKLILIGIGTIGASSGLLAIILLYKNYLYKKTEAENIQADKEAYLEDLDSPRGYGLLSGIKRFKVLEKTGETDIRETAGRRFRASGKVYGGGFRTIDTYKKIKPVREEGRFRVSGNKLYGKY